LKLNKTLNILEGNLEYTCGAATLMLPAPPHHHLLLDEICTMLPDTIFSHVSGKTSAPHWATSPPFSPPSDFDRAIETIVSGAFSTPVLP